MNTASIRSLVFLGLLLAGPLRADVNSDLAFSSFADIDINALAGGKVQQKADGLINFPRGIIAQSLYIVDAEPAAVQKKLITWEPAKHPELDVWLHNSLPAKPTAADFYAGLAALPDNSSVKNLRDATSKLDAANPALQVSKEEAQAIVASLSAPQTASLNPFPGVWSQILAGRITSFLNDKAATDHYSVSGGDIQPVDEIKSLLHADAKVYAQFQRFFSQTPLKTGTGTAVPLAPADLYYECFDVEGTAALGTGAIYQGPSGTSIQNADFEYYVNSGIYASVELEELWPVTVNGKNETLVWRQDMVSAPNVAYLHGTERLASGMIMLQDVRQAVDAFRSEFK